MTNKDFPESNIKIAENQPQYETIHAHWNKEEMSMTMCFELDEDELNRINATGEIWIKVLTFGKPMQPIAGTTLKEVLIKNKENENSQN